MTETAMSRSTAKSKRRVQPLMLLGLAVVVAAVAVVWLVMNRGGSSPAALPSGGPALVSQTQLEQLASKAGHPVYWAGPKAGYSYELTVTRAGRFYVRYLPQGVKAGDPRPSYLVVGTYAASGSYADLKRASKQQGAVSVGIDNHGLSVFSPDRPTSVYFSYPGADYQVEVYSPSPDAARRLVYGGKITPVPAP